MRNSEKPINSVEIPELTKLAAEELDVSAFTLMYFTNQFDDEYDAFLLRVTEHQISDDERDQLTPEEIELEEEFHYLSDMVHKFNNGELQNSDPDMYRNIELAMAIDPRFKESIAGQIFCDDSYEFVRGRRTFDKEFDKHLKFEDWILTLPGFRDQPKNEAEKTAAKISELFPDPPTRPDQPNIEKVEPGVEGKKQFQMVQTEAIDPNPPIQRNWLNEMELEKEELPVNIPLGVVLLLTELPYDVDFNDPEVQKQFPKEYATYLELQKLREEIYKTLSPDDHTYSRFFSVSSAIDLQNLHKLRSKAHKKLEELGSKLTTAIDFEIYLKATSAFELNEDSCEYELFSFKGNSLFGMRDFIRRQAARTAFQDNNNKNSKSL